MNEAQGVIERIAAARTAVDLFGANDGEKARRAARRTLRILGAQVHPDRAAVVGLDVAAATAAFARLGELHRGWLRAGAAAGEAASGAGAPAAVVGRVRRHALGVPLAAGAWATLYATTDGGVAKIARTERSNRLVDVAAASLSRLAAHTRTTPWLAPYYPRLVDVGTISGTGTTRAALVIDDLSRAAGFVSLEQVLAAHPGGLDGRDWAWMMRRLLRAVAGAHDAGLVHGSIAAGNVLIHPAQHGVVLAGWGMSTTAGSPLPARLAPAALGSGYPPELDGAGYAPASTAVDVWMLAALMERMLRADEARQLRFARGCRQVAPGMRPAVVDLQVEYDDLLERLDGPRRFRPFAIPAESR